MELKFCARILQNENMDAAYVEVPYDIKELFGKGRLLVNATFDGIPYRGQVVKMGTPCYIIGVTKQIRKQIDELMDSEISYGDFFRQAPAMNTNREKITGVVCGVRVENVERIEILHHNPFKVVMLGSSPAEM